VEFTGAESYLTRNSLRARIDSESSMVRSGGDYWLEGFTSISFGSRGTGGLRISCAMLGRC